MIGRYSIMVVRMALTHEAQDRYLVAVPNINPTLYNIGAGFYNALVYR